MGGLGGFMQGDGGKYAMGALGGAAAVIGGEMLMHGLENNLGGRDTRGVQLTRQGSNKHNEENGLDSIQIGYLSCYSSTILLRHMSKPSIILWDIRRTVYLTA